MSLRKLLEQYFTSYPTCKEEEDNLDEIRKMTDEKFAQGVIKAFEALKLEIRRLKGLE